MLKICGAGKVPSPALRRGQIRFRRLRHAPGQLANGVHAIATDHLSEVRYRTRSRLETLLADVV